MKKKSMYDGYYDGYYNKAGHRLAKGDIVFNAKGDIVGAKGDIVFNAKGDIVYNAKGDIVGAVGDISNAKGDIVLNSGGTEWDAGEEEEQYVEGDEVKKDGTKLFSALDHIFGYVDQSVDIYGKLKSGVQTEDENYTYSLPADAKPKSNMTMWYVAGGAIVVVVVVAFALKGK